MIHQKKLITVRTKSRHGIVRSIVDYASSMNRRRPRSSNPQRDPNITEILFTIYILRVISQCKIKCLAIRSNYRILLVVRRVHQFEWSADYALSKGLILR